MSKKQSEIIDISGLLRNYAAKWYWFVISVVCCCALGYLYSKTVSPEYEVRANIRLAEDSKTSKFMAGGLSGVSDLLGGNANAVDEVDILMSHTVLRNVAREMELNRVHTVKFMPLIHRFAYNNFPVDVVPDPEIDLDTLRTAVTFKIKVSKNGRADVKCLARNKVILKEKGLSLPQTLSTPYGKYTVLLTPDYNKGKAVNTTVSIVNFDVAAESLRSSVSAGLASKRSQIISLQMITDNENYAIDVLNTLMEKYNERTIGEQEEQTSATAEFLDRRIAALRGDLNRIEKEIADYKENNNIADIKEDGVIIYERMKETERSRQEAEISLRLNEVTLDMVRESAKDNSIIPLQGGETAVALIREYNNLVLRRMRMLESARPDNPALVSLEEQIRTSRANLISTLQTAVERQRQVVDQFRNLYSTTIAQVSGIPAQEKTFYAMERERKIQEEIYLFLLQKQEENAILLSNIAPRGVVVDQAYSLNEDNSMSTKAILLMAFVFGLLIPPVVFMLQRFFRRKFDTVEEVESRVDIPVLGEICQDKSGENLVVVPGRHTSSAELFRLVRTNLQFIMRFETDKVVLVTSTTSGEGKSFISVNIAASMAVMGKRTLLIGMDIRKPRLAEYLDVKPKRGLTQYLADSSVSVEDIISQNAVMPNLDLIVAGPTPPNPAEMLASERVDRLFDLLRRRYSYIIIDAAPVGLVSDTFLLNRLVDATIYVTRANFTKLSDLDYAEKLNEAKRLNHMALVVNGTKSRSGYGYGYGESSSKK